MGLQDDIFEEYFSKLDALTDANKNVDNKGTLQRFVESLAQDFDENIKPFLDDSHQNLIDPRTILTKYFALREAELGNDVLFIGSSDANRRKIIEGWHRYVGIKGTRRAYEIMFSMAGISVVSITEIFNNSGFDSPFTFDSVERPVFDSGRCSPCSFYILELSGDPITDEILQTIYNIIEFNEPINAVLGRLVYNGVDIVNIIPVGLVTGWDTANDGTLDINAVAEFLDDPSGTFRSYQYIKNSIGVPLTTGTVTIQLVASYRYSGLSDEILGTFTGTIADLFSDSGFWVTSFNIYDYFGLTDEVGDGEQLTFAKLLYVNDFGKTNFNAQDLSISISIDIPPLPVSIPRNLFIGSVSVDGTYSSPVDISISKDDTKFYISENSGADGISQNFTDRIYTTRSFATTNSITNSARVKIDTSVNAFGDIIYIEGTDIMFARGISEDANGFTVFDTPETVEAGFTTSGRGIETLDEVVNGKPVIISVGQGGVGAALFVHEWDGVSAWTTTAIPFAGSVFQDGTFGNINTAQAFFYRIGNTLFHNNYQNVNFVGLCALTYTGDYKDKLNWTRVNIADGTLDSASGGILGARGVWVDDSVAGYPDIYMTNPVEQIIQKITTANSTPTGFGDFTITTIAGQSGVAGNTDGIGTASTLTNPMGIDGKSGIVYIVQGVGGNNIRTLNLASLEVVDLKGDFGIAGKTEFEEY